MIGWGWVTRNEWGRWRKESIWTLIGRSALLLLRGALATLVIVAAILGVDALIGLATGELP